MDNSIFSYIQQLELLALFSGYPLLYACVRSFAGTRIALLPITYALLGALYLLLQLRNFFPDFSFERIHRASHQPYLQIWGLSALGWWIPAVRKRPPLSLLHSLVFFFLLVRDFFGQSTVALADHNRIGNDMKIYTDSLLVNGCVFGLVLLASFLFRRRHPAK
jgi:hypothetical protein